jgi:uncharacterized repeat protein (TIGR03803 family)
MIRQPETPGWLLRFWSRLALSVVVGSGLVLAAAQEPAPPLNILHIFDGNPDSAYVRAGLTKDAGGNFYGTTSGGGSYGCGGTGCGTVFRLVHRGAGWVESPIYIFDGTDGALPMGRVIFGPDGSLYGTTAAGGVGACNFAGVPGCGTVFKLQPPQTVCKTTLCFWTKKVLYSFTGSSDGATPFAEVAFDREGNLYSTTLQGGLQSSCSGGCGTVFELAHNSDGTWSESIVWAFQGGTTDGIAPSSEVTLDSSQNLYGTTVTGGQTYLGAGCGIVYKLKHSSSGWTETVLHYFTGPSDGTNPVAGLTIDIANNLYGATAGYGTAGGVYELDPGSDGYAFTRLHVFGTHEAANASSRLTMDVPGNFYGTSQQGGAYGDGTVYELANVSGVWTYIPLHDFNLSGGDAGTPYGAIVLVGNDLYGTTDAGPDGSGHGVAFKIP